jgi:hypothetical protein
MRIAVTTCAAVALVAQVAFAGDDAPPTLAEIAAAIRSREAATLPRGLTYANSTSRRDTTWIEHGVRVVRFAAPAGEYVAVWDGSMSYSGKREDGGPWSGHVGREKHLTNYPVWNSVCLLFAPTEQLLSEAIADPKAELLGWTTYDGVQCVAVRTSAQLDRVYELDPARAYLPLRVSLVFTPTQPEDGTRKCPDVVIAGNTFKTFTTCSSSSWRDLGGGAWVPGVTTTTGYDGNISTETLVSTDHVEHVRPGVVGSVLEGTGQLQVRGRKRLLRFEGDSQWEVDDRRFFGGQEPAPWPPPLWLRPRALVIEALAAIALVSLGIWRVLRRRGDLTARPR